MNKFIIGLLAAANLGLSPLLTAGEITPELKARINVGDARNDIPVIIQFTDRLDITALREDVKNILQRKYSTKGLRTAQRRRIKRKLMIDRMKQLSFRSVNRVARFLHSRGVQPVLKPLWMRNSVAASIPSNLLEDVALLPGIESVTLDATVQGPTPNAGSAPTAPTFWNLDATQAPLLWNLGYTGTGVVVASMDTGVDATHPDLGPKWRGGTNSWFDPYGQNSSPADNNGHGTQVMGLIVGGASGGYQIGMAPDAQWIAAKIFNDANQATLSGIHEAYQWMLDPDGDFNTDDAPDLVNNSWALNNTVNQCNQEFSSDIALLKEAEIGVLFSAGNYGPSTETSVSPANDTGVVSVGSVDSAYGIDIQSSRGSGACDGGIYPSLVAPGDGVLTADRMPTFYNYVSGTSFAVAHLTGGMALLKSAFPQATLSQLENAVSDHAGDLGNPGPDNTFGHGLLDVNAAYSWLESILGNANPQPGEFSFSASGYSVDENVATLTISVNRTGGSSGAVSVDYASADVSALAGLDYLASSGTLQFNDGEVSQSFSISILNDNTYEADESFELSLSNPQGGASLGSTTLASVTIFDDDPMPPAGNLQFSAASYDAAENGGNVLVTVTRSGGSFGPVSVNYATADGSAQANSDYQSTSGVLNFAEGELSRSFTVTIIDDSLYEGDESFNIHLSNAGGGASLGNPASTAVTILDNDSSSLVDADGDGFTSDIDCNDNNDQIYPGAAEIKHDGIDQDCNGYDLTIDITRAWYQQSRDRVIVWATSDAGSQAELSLTVSLQNGSTLTRKMAWNARKNRWQKTLGKFAAKYGMPTDVSVSGTEGTESAAMALRP